MKAAPGFDDPPQWERALGKHSQIYSYVGGMDLANILSQGYVWIDEKSIEIESHTAVHSDLPNYI